jgi:hypothetical protein
MPRYHFHLHDGHGVRSDLDGTLLPDAEAARDHGAMVAHELMRNREPCTRYWKLDVCDPGGELLFDLEFARLDNTLDHLPPALRESVIRVGDRLRSVAETIDNCRMTVLQSKALMAHADGKPYVIAENGRRVEV